MQTSDRGFWRRLLGAENGQAAPLWVAAGMLLLSGISGTAIDMSNAWLHRQWADTAAEASCEAGAMDLLYGANNDGHAPSSTYDFDMKTNGASGDCAASSSTSMCVYAKLNGYSSPGITAGTASNDVSWSLSPTGPTGTTPPTVPNSVMPYMTVTVTENVPVYLLGMFHAFSHTIQVVGTCTCGLEAQQTATPSYLPMYALGNDGPGFGYYVFGTQQGIEYDSSGDETTFYPTFTVTGGGSTAVEESAVNVTSGQPDYLLGNGGTWNLSGGGSGSSGASVSVYDYSPMPSPSQLMVSSNFGTFGNLTTASSAPGDPFSWVQVPTSQASVTPVTGTGGVSVTYGQDGCPAHSGCLEFGPGYYPDGMSLDATSDLGTVVLVIPGIYYLGEDVGTYGWGLMANSPYVIYRVATPCTPSCGPKTAGMTDRQTDGVMFYVSNGGWGQINYEMDRWGSGNQYPINVYSQDQVDPVPSTRLTCDGSAPAGVPSEIYGSVLYGLCTANGSYYDSGADNPGDSAGEVRGIVMFLKNQYDSTVPTNTSIPLWGDFAIGGSIYIQPPLGDTASGTSGNVGFSVADGEPDPGYFTQTAYVLGTVVGSTVKLSANTTFIPSVPNGSVTTQGPLRVAKFSN